MSWINSGDIGDGRVLVRLRQFSCGAGVARMNAIAAAVFVLCFLWLEQFGFTATKDEIIQAAKQEGELVFYASLGLEDANSLINQFTKKYPFLKVRQNRLKHERLLNTS